MANFNVVKTVDNPTPPIGTDVTFTIILENFNLDVQTDIVVFDLLPSGYTFVSALTGNGTYDPVTGLWEIPSLNPAQQGSLLITATVLCSGTYDNTATIINPPQPPPNSSTQVVMPTGEFCNGRRRRRSQGAMPATVCLNKNTDNCKPQIVVGNKTYIKIWENNNQCCYAIRN